MISITFIRKHKQTNPLEKLYLLKLFSFQYKYTLKYTKLGVLLSLVHVDKSA